MDHCDASCLCLEQAIRAWQRIDQMLEISLEMIIVATAQTVDSARQSQGCLLHSAYHVATMRDLFLRIYTKLVEFLRAALTTYTTNTTPITTTTPLERMPLFIGGAPASPLSLDNDPRDETGQGKTAHPGGILCRPSKMALGEHGLNEQESRCLALDLIGRTLTNIVVALQQMDVWYRADPSQPDSKVTTLLFQATQLAENTTANLHSFRQVVLDSG